MHTRICPKCNETMKYKSKYVRNYAEQDKLICNKCVQTTHGMCHTLEYRCWIHMKQRCLNTNTTGYNHYGGRGINVCDRWLNSFENFYADMGPRPDGMSIDRKDNDGNYEPGNCRWATLSEQEHNKRTSKKENPRGVCKVRKIWRATIQKDGKRYTKTFDTKYEAIVAHKKMSQILYLERPEPRQRLNVFMNL